MLDKHNALAVPAIFFFDKYFADCSPYVYALLTTDESEFEILNML